MKLIRLFLLISLSLLLLSWQAARAQSVDDFFHSGAQSYITNNITGARQAVDAGLAVDPNDIKLKQLDELLKKQSQQQQQQNQQQQQQNQQQQQQKNQQQQQQKNQDQKQQNQQQKNQQSQQNQQPENQQSPSKDGQKEKSDAPKEQKQAAAREMSPEEAKRLLDVQKGDEQLLQFQPKNPPESQNKPIKDW